MPKWLRRKPDYHPGGYVGETVHHYEWGGEAYETLNGIVKIQDTIYGDIVFTQHPPKPKKPSERCHGCGSSEFDGTGKCVYCRQFQVRGES